MRLRFAIFVLGLGGCGQLLGVDELVPAGECFHAKGPAPLGAPCGLDGACDGLGECRATLGAACEEAASCATGVCEQGTCCERACLPCETCGAPDSAGTCAPVAAGKKAPSGQCAGVCDGSGHCVSGAIEAVWLSQEVGTDVGYGLSRDPDGKVVVVGQGAGAFGGGANALFVAKFALGAALTKVWGVAFGGTAADIGYGVAHAHDGSLVAGGACAKGEAWPLGAPCPGAAGSADGVVAHFDARGAPLATSFIGSNRNDFVFDAAVSPSGEVVAAGLGAEPLEDLPRPLLATVSLGDGTLATTYFGDGGGVGAFHRIAFRPDGSLVAIGWFSGELSFGEGRSLKSADALDVLVVGFDAKREPAWAVSFGGEGDDYGQDLAVDDDGELAIVGQYASELSWGTGALAASHGPSGFIAKLDADGELLWGHSLDGTSVVAHSVVRDAWGNWLVAGYFEGRLTAGTAVTATYQANGTHDAFWLKLGRAGTPLWHAVLGGPGTDRAHRTLLEPDGGSLTVGASDGEFFLEGKPAAHAGTDTLLVKLSP